MKITLSDHDIAIELDGEFLEMRSSHSWPGLGEEGTLKLKVNSLKRLAEMIQHRIETEHDRLFRKPNDSLREHFSKRPDFQDWRHWMNAKRQGIFWHILLDGVDTLTDEYVEANGGSIASCISGGWIDRYKYELKENGERGLISAYRNPKLGPHDRFHDKGRVIERIFGKVEHLRCDEFECFHKKQSNEFKEVTASFRITEDGKYSLSPEDLQKIQQIKARLHCESDAGAVTEKTGTEESDQPKTWKPKEFLG